MVLATTKKAYNIDTWHECYKTSFSSLMAQAILKSIFKVRDTLAYFRHGISDDEKGFQHWYLASML